MKKSLHPYIVQTTLLSCFFIPLAMIVLFTPKAYGVMNKDNASYAGSNGRGISSVSSVDNAATSNSNLDLSYPLNKVSFESDSSTYHIADVEQSGNLDTFFNAGISDTVDFTSLSTGAASLGSNLGSKLGSVLNNDSANSTGNFAAQSSSSATQGDYWDEEKGINLDSIWGDITNLQQDVSGDIKKLFAGEISKIKIPTSYTDLAAAGVPVEYIDLGPTGIATVVYEAQLPTAMESIYASSKEFSAALGPAGNMDYRNGYCNIKGFDYTWLINTYIEGAGSKNEGKHPYLYLDTNCWITIGIGSIIKEYSSPRNWDGYKAYFDKMEYVDKDGLLVDQATKDKDLKFFFNWEGKCRKDCGCSADCTAKSKTVGCCTNVKTIIRNGKKFRYCINEKYSTYEKKTHGRHITAYAAKRMIFDELCYRHIQYLVPRSGGVYPRFNYKLQEVLLDISYQGGVPTALIRQLKTGSCGNAVSTFSASALCTGFPERCQWRKAALKAGCDMGVFSTLKPITKANQPGTKLKNKKTGEVKSVDEIKKAKSKSKKKKKK